MKVAVGLSGGVDSSVAALLLLRAGHDVTGVQMRTWPGPDEPAGAATRSACFGRDEAGDRLAAEGVCARLGIPFRVVDCSEAYEEIVLRYVREAYAAGTTPNPCVRCNPLVKFGVLPEAARAAGLAFDRFATGHYARVEPDAPSGRLLLKRAADARKDQSYFLYRLSQAQLATVLFPLGDLSKDRVREFAREAGLPVHDRRESQDFYDGDIADLLGGPGSEGDVVDREGRVLGRHRGVRSYTVGQRKGLGLTSPAPLYVLAIDAAANRLVVGPEGETYRRAATIRDCVWGPFEALAAPAAVRVKVRSAGRPVPATVSPLPGDLARIDFAEPVSSVAPGQSAVLYDGDTVVGGGVIEPSV
jgi:tRNA-uridine 2-sulfurtransferase